jgi:hypothetical protein
MNYRSVTVNVADFETTRVAEMLVVPGNRVLIVNVAVVCPAGTRTLDGTVATSLLLLDNVTDVPPDCAGPLSVTIPVEEVPNGTEAGLNVREAS